MKSKLATRAEGVAAIRFRCARDKQGVHNNCNKGQVLDRCNSEYWANCKKDTFLQMRAGQTNRPPLAVAVHRVAACAVMKFSQS